MNLRCENHKCYNILNIHKYRKHGKTLRYCSNKCNQRYFKKRKPQKTKRHIGKKERCSLCNSKFILKTRQSQYCSHQCYLDSMYKARRKKLKTKYKNETQEFYFAENDYFYKFGRTSRELGRFQEHSRVKLNIRYTITDSFYNVVNYERLIKNFVVEHNLKYDPLFAFDGHTETICKSKLDKPEAKWLIDILKNKKEISNELC